MANSILKRAIIKEELVVLTGNFALATTLNQLLYWSKRVKDSDGLIAEELERISTNKVSDLRHGWIYKSSEELSQEIMLGSPSTVRRNLNDYGHSNVPPMTKFLPSNDKEFTTKRQLIYHPIPSI